MKCQTVVQHRCCEKPFQKKQCWDRPQKMREHTGGDGLPFFLRLKRGGKELKVLLKKIFLLQII